ncbi:MAG: diadenylate cyclase [Microthrixaceae bacterium]
MGRLRLASRTAHRCLIDVVHSCGDPHDIAITRALLDLAVHDLGANGIGAPVGLPRRHRRPPDPTSTRSCRCHSIRIDRPTDLAPLRQCPAQIDGAAVFGPDGVLRQLGVHLMPSDEVARTVDGFRGTRHTSGLRYSYDDPAATVITVSEDGPVAVFRRGSVLGRSDPTTGRG